MDEISATSKGSSLAKGDAAESKGQGSIMNNFNRNEISSKTQRILKNKI